MLFKNEYFRIGLDPEHEFTADLTFISIRNETMRVFLSLHLRFRAELIVKNHKKEKCQSSVNILYNRNAWNSNRNNEKKNNSLT